MNRRKFIRAFAGAVATVAIGMKLSQGMPEIPKVVLASPDMESALRFGDPNIVAMKIKVNMDHGLDVEWVDWRAMYGTPSGLEGEYEQT